MWWSGGGWAGGRCAGALCMASKGVTKASGVRQSASPHSHPHPSHTTPHTHSIPAPPHPTPYCIARLLARSTGTLLGPRAVVHVKPREAKSGVVPLPVEPPGAMSATPARRLASQDREPDLA